MKYSDKYPNAEYAQNVEHGIIKGKRKDNCYVCGTLTDFIDIDFECHICSEECLDKITDEFIKASMKKGSIEFGNIT